jgi:L-threonylcarbamoyladenylate synthase
MPCQVLEPTEANFQTVRKELARGHPVALPTETVYGLAANACDDRAIAQIYTFKNRPHFNPLIIHFASLQIIIPHVISNARLEKLAHAFWPGPLTLVLHKQPSSPISLLATAGLETVAVRIPNHPLMQKILSHLDFPLAAPSANPSEHLSPTSAQAVAQGFTHLEEDLKILDGGPCPVGLESTILDLTMDTPQILRPGCITIQEIEAVLGCPVLLPHDAPLKAPGQMKRHYAPKIPLRLNVTSVHSDEALLSFGAHTLTGAAVEMNLSPRGNLLEAAANLFNHLYILESGPYRNIAVMPLPKNGIGLALNDRLNRGATQNY